MHAEYVVQKDVQTIVESDVGNNKADVAVPVRRIEKDALQVVFTVTHDTVVAGAVRTLLIVTCARLRWGLVKRPAKVAQVVVTRHARWWVQDIELFRLALHRLVVYDVTHHTLNNPRERTEAEHPFAPEVGQLRRWLYNTTEHNDKRKEGRKQHRCNHSIR